MSRKDKVLHDIMAGLFGVFIGTAAFCWMVLMFT